jgi:hypothetical protein
MFNMHMNKADSSFIHMHIKHINTLYVKKILNFVLLNTLFITKNKKKQVIFSFINIHSIN